jgi:hypothetical protein
LAGIKGVKVGIIVAEAADHVLENVIHCCVVGGLGEFRKAREASLQQAGERAEKLWNWIPRHGIFRLKTALACQ